MYWDNFIAPKVWQFSPGSCTQDSNSFLACSESALEANLRAVGRECVDLKDVIAWAKDPRYNSGVALQSLEQGEFLSSLI